MLALEGHHIATFVDGGSAGAAAASGDGGECKLAGRHAVAHVRAEDGGVIAIRDCACVGAGKWRSGVSSATDAGGGRIGKLISTATVHTGVLRTGSQGEKEEGHHAKQREGNA